jgi:hypothetical protein
MFDIYVRLLADVSELSGVPLGAPDEISNEWMLITAPKLDKELLLFLEGSGGLPEFPEWVKPLVDRFVSSMDPKYLKYLRQLLLFCYKIEFEPQNEQLIAAQAAFEETEASNDIWDLAHKSGQGPSEPLLASARQIVGKVIYRINWSSILPSHGPGAVYPSCKTHEKSKFTTIYPSIEVKYPFADFFCAIPSFWDRYIWVHNGDLTISEDIVSRLVAVPKDSRGPRLICVHPKESIWIQQGQRRLLERAITAKGSPCHGRITFDDQTTNGKLALLSSKTREFVTLDLKEASDRITCSLVKSLFGDYAYEWMSCARANKVRLLDDRVITLRKWAPMGNALCFPVQSLIFYALVRAGIRSRYGINCSDVYVFGDDILFPSKFYDGAVSALVCCGLVPNIQKTFRHGFFRESCGVDAFNGVDVTPHRLRKLDFVTVSGAMSACTLAKALVQDGFRLTADSLYRYVSRYHGLLPLSNNPDTQGIFRYEAITFDKLLRYEPSLRFNRERHVWQTSVRLVGGTNYRPSNDAWWHLQDSLVRLHHLDASEPSTRGLEYSVPHRSRSKRGWTLALLKG